MQQPCPTLKLYEQDAYQTACSTTLCGVLPTAKGGVQIALKQSIFFAEGGGQPADRGTVTFVRDGGSDENAQTHAQILDVHEKDGVLWHTLDATPAQAKELERWVGCTVTCTLDWAHRLDSMQQHSGEHILSGVLHQLYSAENVGFHIGADDVRMDTSCPLSAAQLQAAENMANELIWQNIPIETLLPDGATLATMTYRSKKEIAGTVRIVQIAGADTCACCGTHLRTTGGVGQIKILSAEHYKGGERLSVVCGKRALTAAQGMRTRETEIGALLSAKPALTAAAVQRVYGEYNALKVAKSGIEQQLFDALAAQIDPTSTAPAIVTVAGLTPDGLHRLASRLSEATNALCVALCEQAGSAQGAATQAPKHSDTPAQATPAGTAHTSPKPATTGYCMAQRGNGVDLRPLCKALNATCNGRGGGKPNICQGSAAARAAELTIFLQNNQ